ncbi:hypothetical protein ACFY5D_16635 [Paeniglutamicibacter sp. NPDC012692]|uniref:hypothetical protein n=1 Tax=Paeniglutamicibacter sp. NPDC012692 TaxID=3364388 RepID=UPI0036A7B3C0
MIDQTPWFVSSPNAQHSSEVARVMAYAGTGGKEGISAPGDLKVTAQSVPNGTVRVAPGGGVMLSRYAGGTSQSYVGRNATTTNVAIAPTTSAGKRSDLVVLRVLDPAFEGQPPSDPTNFDYTRLTVIQGVAANTTDAAKLNLSYPAIALARIDIPASTGAITQAMIKDVRRVANPREESHVIARPSVMGDQGLTLTSKSAYPDGEWMPNFGGDSNNGVHTLHVPSWATQLEIRAEWLGVRYNNKAGYGYYWVTFGPDATSANPSGKTQAFSWDADESASIYRSNWILHDQNGIPASWRGTDINFVLRANRRNTNAQAGTVSLDGLSGITLSVRFLETSDD